MQVDLIFSIAVLVMSVVIHEVAHGAVAQILGDPTARLAGRLTLNPIKHLDFIGSLAVPAVMAILGGPIFGWAKPVPYNPYNLRSRFGPALVAGAGPAANILLAVVFGLLLRTGLIGGVLGPAAVSLVAVIVFINIILALFNLLPVPPLDGSKILFNLLPYRWRFIETTLNQYSLLLIVLIIFSVGALIGPLSAALFSFLTGLA